MFEVLPLLPCHACGGPRPHRVIAVGEAWRCHACGLLKDATDQTRKDSE
jgi:hypothetical protein